MHRFWNEKSCGEVYAQWWDARERFEAQAREGYLLEPHTPEFAAFAEGRRNVLEIAVGMGADHLEWARARPQSLSGINLTGTAQFRGEILQTVNLYVERRGVKITLRTIVDATLGARSQFDEEPGAEARPERCTK